MSFQRGETIICSCEVRNKAGSYVDPATSMTITITNCDDTPVVSNRDMVKDETGKYHYDFDSSGASKKGVCAVYYKAIDGARIAITKNTFQVG